MHTVTEFLVLDDGVRPVAIAMAKSRRGGERKRTTREILVERKERAWMAAKGPTRGQPWLPGEYCTTVRVCVLYSMASVGVLYICTRV
ncbi:hypothetical protein RHMOL_Rhmol03G0279100 [Rhododendron molle]|uniref:Uncharacterized protein n=1 Tax=Rhododendron molle TaxID=49168 RepID=A0ACC0PJA4_RHOML|nr:hypothetical protein RHMOL_Rhmol03G0279100 [Rhododendron molle]